MISNDINMDGSMEVLNIRMDVQSFVQLRLSGLRTSGWKCCEIPRKARRSGG